MNRHTGITLFLGVSLAGALLLAAPAARAQMRSAQYQKLVDACKQLADNLETMQKEKKDTSEIKKYMNENSVVCKPLGRMYGRDAEITELFKRLLKIEQDTGGPELSAEEKAGYEKILQVCLAGVDELEKVIEKKANVMDAQKRFGAISIAFKTVKLALAKDERVIALDARLEKAKAALAAWDGGDTAGKLEDMFDPGTGPCAQARTQNAGKWRKEDPQMEEKFFLGQIEKHEKLEIPETSEAFAANHNAIRFLLSKTDEDSMKRLRELSGACFEFQVKMLDDNRERLKKVYLSTVKKGCEEKKFYKDCIWMLDGAIGRFANDDELKALEKKAFAAELAVIKEKDELGGQCVFYGGKAKKGKRGIVNVFEDGGDVSVRCFFKEALATGGWNTGYARFDSQTKAISNKTLSGKENYAQRLKAFLKKGTKEGRNRVGFSIGYEFLEPVVERKYDEARQVWEERKFNKVHHRTLSFGRFIYYKK